LAPFALQPLRSYRPKSRLGIVLGVIVRYSRIPGVQYPGEEDGSRVIERGERFRNRELQI
jgi:hypothetical protein